MVAVGGEDGPEVFEVMDIVQLRVFAFDLGLGFLQFFSLQLSRFSVRDCADKVLGVWCKLASCLMYLRAATVFTQFVAVHTSPFLLPVVVAVVGLEVIRYEAGEDILPRLP